MSESGVVMEILVRNEVEMWKTVRCNDRYEVSNMGRVRRKETGHILKGVPGSRKNLQVQLYFAHGRRVQFYIHRLVAEHWLLDYVDHLRIVHKNEDKNDCRVINLHQEQHTKSARWQHPEGSKELSEAMGGKSRVVQA